MVNILQVLLFLIFIIQLSVLIFCIIFRKSLSIYINIFIETTEEQMQHKVFDFCISYKFFQIGLRFPLYYPRVLSILP